MHGPVKPRNEDMVHKKAVGSRVRNDSAFLLISNANLQSVLFYPVWIVGETDKAASDNCVGVVWKKPPQMWEFA
jgi:hypothetical protein